MPIVNVQFQTVTCDGPGCKNTVTFAANPQDHAKAAAENPWLVSTRGVTAAGANPDNSPRTFVYCSDACEVNNVTAGAHNPPQKKVIDIATGSAALKQAAAQAAAQQAADKAIREGGPTR